MDGVVISPDDASSERHTAGASGMVVAPHFLYLRLAIILCL